MRTASPSWSKWPRTHNPTKRMKKARSRALFSVRQKTRRRGAPAGGGFPAESAAAGRRRRGRQDGGNRMKIVTSTQNPAVRALRELGQAKARAQRGLFLAEGVKLCAEALRDAQVETVLCDEARAGEFSTLLAACGDVLLAPAHIVASACQTQTP